MTLLELLVVVALMSAVGFMALSQVGDDLGQARYQDTENRLIALRRAIIGYEEPVFNGQRLFSGYAADNGRILTTEDGIVALIEMPDGFDEYGIQSPIFDPTPDTSGYNNDNGDHTVLTSASMQIFKGWRGAYLATRPSEKDLSGQHRAYRDGWGNQGADETADEVNFGWTTNFPDANTITIRSLGRDGMPDPAFPNEPEIYDADVSIAISPNDWMVNIAEWSVKIMNGTGQDIVLDDPEQCFQLWLLVYRNSSDKDQGRWQRFKSKCVEKAAPYGSCIDGDGNNRFILLDNPDTTLDESINVSCPSVAQFETSAPSIPQGRHLLLLVLHDDNPNTDKPCTTGSGTHSAQDCVAISVAPSTKGPLPKKPKADVFLSVPVDFFSRATLPSIFQLGVTD